MSIMPGAVMREERRPIDDYALAAFITGKLPGNSREEILDALQDDLSAQYLLERTIEALSGARRPDEAMLWLSQNWKRAA